MSARGFTLVELMVTLAVVAVLAAVGVPYLLGSLPTFRVNAAARELVADFRLARTLAVERGRDALVQFHRPGPNDYTVGIDTHPADEGDHQLTADDEVVKVIRLGELYEGIEFTTYAAGSGLPADGISFVNDLALFKPGGTAQTGAAYVRPAADAGVTRLRERKVTIDGSTGRARAYRWNGTTWE